MRLNLILTPLQWWFHCGLLSKPRKWKKSQKSYLLFCWSMTPKNAQNVVTLLRPCISKGTFSKNNHIDMESSKYSNDTKTVYNNKMLRNSIYRRLFSKWNRTVTHGLINYIDTKAKCRHLKKLASKGTLRHVFIRVYRLEIQSVMLIFSTQLCELLLL